MSIFKTKGGLFHVEHSNFVLGQDCLCEIELKLRFSQAPGTRCARHAARPEDRDPGLTPPTPGEREPGEREPGEREPGEREPGEREPGEREPGSVARVARATVRVSRFLTLRHEDRDASPESMLRELRDYVRHSALVLESTSKIVEGAPNFVPQNVFSLGLMLIVGAVRESRCKLLPMVGKLLQTGDLLLVFHVVFSGIRPATRASDCDTDSTRAAASSHTGHGARVRLALSWRDAPRCAGKGGRAVGGGLVAGSLGEGALTDERGPASSGPARDDTLRPQQRRAASPGHGR